MNNAPLKPIALVKFLWTVVNQNPHFHSDVFSNTFGTNDHFIRNKCAFHSNEMTFSFGCFWAMFRKVGEVI